MQLMPHRQAAGGGDRRAGDAGDVGVRRQPGGREQRGAPAGRRPQRRLGVQRRRRLGYIADVGNARRRSPSRRPGGLGEAEVGGPAMNIVPKAGGNTLRGSVLRVRRHRGMVGSNYTDELRAAGLTTPGETAEVVGLQLGVGGPIFAIALVLRHVRDQAAASTIPGMFANLNAGDPTKWTYVPTDREPAACAAPTSALRLTVQSTPRNKFGVLGRAEAVRAARATGDSEGCRNPETMDLGVTAGADGSPTPSARRRRAGNERRLSSIRTSACSRPSGRRRRRTAAARGGFGTYQQPLGRQARCPAIRHRDLIRVEQCATGCGGATAASRT